MQISILNQQRALLNKPHALILMAFVLAEAHPAIAGSEAPATSTAPAITVSGSVTLVSDYLFRGISQTWGKPALQLAMEANHSSGLYGGLFASNVSDQMFAGTMLELDLYGGKRGKLPGALSDLNYDLGLVYIFYPGGNYDEAKFPVRYQPSKFNTAEVYASLNYRWFTVKSGRSLTKFFGWNANNSGLNGGFYGDPLGGVTGNTQGSWFAEGTVSVDVAEGWNISATAGHQTIAHSQNLDWSYFRTGVTRTFKGNWAANISYSATTDTRAYSDFWGLQNTGSTHDVAQGKLLFSISRNF